MPPITAAELSEELHEELSDSIAAMKRVDLTRIHDMRSAHEEFVRCKMDNARIRGLCSTNLLFQQQERAAHGTSGGASVVTARWKCNLPVLEQCWATGALFLPNGITPRAPLIDVPVLSVLGGESPIGQNAMYHGLWRRFARDLDEHVVPNATHTVYFDQPKATLQLVEAFLRHLELWT